MHFCHPERSEGSLVNIRPLPAPRKNPSVVSLSQDDDQKTLFNNF